MTAVFRRELQGYFGTPIGYIFIAAFIAVMNTMFYLVNIRGAYADITVLFPFMLIVLAVLIPVLTMRSFAEEFKLKTDQMLFTAPVSVGGVVMGKFLAALAVFLLSLLTTLPWLFIVAAYATPNTAAVAGCYVAVVLAGGAFIALGMFFSVLTENQIVAAVLSFSVFLAVYLLGSLAGSWTGAGWARTLIGWFSLFARYNSISKGILSLADIVYYLSFSGLFLYFTASKLERKIWS